MMRSPATLLLGWILHVQSASTFSTFCYKHLIVAVAAPRGGPLNKKPSVINVADGVRLLLVRIG